MLVRFTLSNNSYTDMGYFINAIYNIATASAGVTTISNAGTITEVLDSTYAGGWSPLTGTLSTSLTTGTNATYAGNYLGLISPTPKTGVYKAFEIYTNATTGTTYGIALARLSQYNGSSISVTTKYGTSVNLGSSASSSANTSGCDSLFGSQSLPSSAGPFYVSATSNYIWIYAVGSGNLVGCSDLTAGASFDYDVKSLHFPAAGLMVCAGANGATQSAANYYTATAGIANFQRGETNYDFNDLWGYNTQNIAIPGITTGSYTKNLELTPFLPVIPAFGTIQADNTTYKTTWSSDGYARYSVNDISLYNPWQGYPIRTFYGLKIIGWDRYNTVLPPTLQFQRIQVGSQKYICFTTGTNGRVVFGFAE